MRLLVFGGRHYHNSGVLFAALDHLHDRLGISCVIHGAAKGADRLAQLWARGADIADLAEPARWKDLSHPDAIIRYNQFGRFDSRAGMRRNALMLSKHKPSHGLQFPGGVGTMGMRQLLDVAGVPVFQVYENAFHS